MVYIRYKRDKTQATGRHSCDLSDITDSHNCFSFGTAEWIGVAMRTTTTTIRRPIRVIWIVVVVMVIVWIPPHASVVVLHFYMPMIWFRQVPVSMIPITMIPPLLLQLQLLLLPVIRHHFITYNNPRYHFINPPILYMNFLVVEVVHHHRLHPK